MVGNVGGGLVVVVLPLLLAAGMAVNVETVQMVSVSSGEKKKGVQRPVLTMRHVEPLPFQSGLAWFKGHTERNSTSLQAPHFLHHHYSHKPSATPFRLVRADGFLPCPLGYDRKSFSATPHHRNHS